LGVALAGSSFDLKNQRKPTETNEMSNDQKLTERQRRVIPYLLVSPSIEGACRRAGINKTTVYQWMRDDFFRQELKKQRHEVIERALDSLKANLAKATETLVKHLDSKRENISIRAAESIIGFTQKALEHEELAKRLAALEERITHQGQSRR
jgi:response regulator RpfG family c-di-GMP phosphodiesterase